MENNEESTNTGRLLGLCCHEMFAVLEAVARQPSESMYHRVYVPRGNVFVSFESNFMMLNFHGELLAGVGYGEGADTVNARTCLAQSLQ